MIIDVGDTVAFGGVTIGATDSYGVETYFTALDGWGAPQSTVQATQKAAGDGAFASPAYLQARHVTVSGALVAPSRPALVAAMDRLQAAASINPQPVTVTIGGAVRYIVGQRQGEVTISGETDVYLEFHVTFLAVDPRKFGADIVTSTRLPSGTGGWTFPFTFPLTIASTIVNGICSASSPGSLPGKVKLRIDGPVVGPVVTHVASGQSLILSSSYSLAAGNWLTVDMDAHTILENDQADRAGYVLSRGWSAFDSGINTWAFSAVGYNARALLTVTATPAWL